MSSPSLRLVASNPSLRPRKPAIRHHLSIPVEETGPVQSQASLVRMGLAAAAVPMIWLGHAMLVYFRLR